jgi:ABC-type transporter Mla subunit MlaD
MDNQTLLWLIAAFFGLAALSMLGQAMAAIGMYRRVKALQETVTPLIPRAESLLSSAQTTLTETREQLRDLTAKSNEILDSTRTQLTRIDSVMNDASARAKLQIEHADQVLRTTLDRVDHTAATLHNGVLAPLNQITGLVTGVRAGLGAFLGARRTPVSSATQDEEMFI